MCNDLGSMCVYKIKNIEEKMAENGYFWMHEIQHIHYIERVLVYDSVSVVPPLKSPLESWVLIE